MAIFFISTQYSEAFEHSLSSMRGCWECGLMTTLFTPEYCSLLWVL